MGVNRMLAYMKVVDIYSPVHERYYGQEVKITTKTKIDKEGNKVGDYMPAYLLYRNNVDRNLRLIQEDIEELSAQYDITKMILE